MSVRQSERLQGRGRESDHPRPNSLTRPPAPSLLQPLTLPSPPPNLLTLRLAYCTRWSQTCTAVCREKVGGQGILSCNKIGDLNNVAASLVVVEGDSMVLGQKVAGELLKQFSGSGMASTVAALAMGSFGEVAGSLLSSLTFTPISLESRGVQRSLMASKQRSLCMSLTRSILVNMLKGGRKRVMSEWSKALLQDVQNLCDSYVEISAFDAICAAEEAAVGDAKALLSTLRSLFALQIIERDLGWYLANVPSLSRATARQVGPAVEYLCRSVPADSALALVDAFGFDDQILGISIARGDEWEMI